MVYEPKLIKPKLHQTNSIPGGMQYAGGLTPGDSENFPGSFFESYGSGPNLPPVCEDEERRMRERPQLGLSLQNVMLGALAVFILAIGLLVVLTTIGTVDDSTQMRVYDETTVIDNPLVDQYIATGYFQLSGFTVQYNDGAWHTIPAAGYSYSITTGILTVPSASINVLTTEIRVQAKVTLSEPPTMPAFSILGAALVILSIFSIVMMLWFRNRF